MGDLFLGLIIFELTLVFIVWYLLYIRLGVGAWFFHGILGWHIPAKGSYWDDGCSVHATCKHCGKDIMQDSQGNWFC